MRVKNKCYAYSKLLLTVFVLHSVQQIDAECNGFLQTTAWVNIFGKSRQIRLSGCLDNLPYEEIRITGCVENIQPQTFKNMLNLENIIIDAGNLHEISPNFTENTPSLKQISVHQNRLTKIWKGTFPPTALQKLDLTSNRIAFIEGDAFKGVTSKFLILDDNYLKNVESKWFDNSDITYLSLSRNRISYIQSNAFKGIRNLKEINLSYNFINYIDDNTFNHMRSLRNLNLTGNTLTHLNFLNSIKLTKVDVGFNRISYISPKNMSIQYFFVFPNPWQCNCLQEFWKFAVANNIGVGNTPSTKATWREIYPVCVAKNPKCSKHENYDDIRMQYFKNVNYAKLDN